MSVSPGPDEDLIRRLPLPLSQLYRRACNAKTSLDRHHNAYYLAEAALKLAASLRIGAALQAGLDHRSPLARSLEQLCLPSAGHWAGFLRDSSEYLHARPDAALLPVASTHEALSRHEALPAVREFADRASRDVEGGQPPIGPGAARDASRRGVLGFFELVVTYRNQVFGHAAQRPPAFYDELGPLLLAASAEVLGQDCLFGGLTLAVARLAPGDSARSVRLEWQGLQGLASLMLPAESVGPEPDPSEEAARRAAGRVVFVARGVRVPVHPLVVYHEDRSERERVGFLNRTVVRRREAEGDEVRRCDYLDYATGDHIPEVDARAELAELLARLRGRPATPADVERLILESRAESGETLPAPPLATGSVIADFALEGELGRGGMGVVYRARQRSLNRTVALKVLPPSMAADPVSLGRFRREIAALARCDHPNLVKILTSGAVDDRHYYAMELVEGMDLAALFEVLATWNRSARGHLREGHLPAAVSTSSDLARRRQESRDAEPLPDLEPIAPAPPPDLESGRTFFEALGTLFADAADALAHLHARGIIHRDVKPANLMLTLDGRRLVVMDLGLAQLRDRSQSLTADGTRFVGTLRYTSPEQLQRNLLEVDERTDVYGLGATLYEMATLAPIFDGDTQQRLIEQVLHQEPKSLRAFEPEVPRDLAAIALHCLDKDRSQRYANARDLAEDLRRFATGEAVSVREPGQVERALKWARRKPTLAAAYTLGLLALLLGGLGGLALWQWRVAARERNTAVTERDGKENARADAERQRKAADDARLGEVQARANVARSEYGRTIELAHQEWRDNNIPASRALLDGTRPDLRGWEWRYVHRLLHSDLLTLRGHAGWVRSASFSPDGARVVTAGGDKTARVWDARSGAEVLTLEGHRDTVNSASFSPDGARVVTASNDNTAKIWDARSGAEVLTLRWHVSWVRSASFSPDGARVVTVSSGSTATVWDARSGAEVLMLKGLIDRVSSASFSPDGAQIVTAIEDQTARVWDARSGAQVLTLRGHAGWVRSASFSPDGARVVTANGDGTARVWDARSGAEVLTLRGHRDTVSSASFSPDGARIVTASLDNTAKVWDARSGAEVLTLKGHSGWFHAASFSPDGARIVTAGGDDKTARVWDARSGAEVLTLEGHSDWVDSASFSPDGARVVTANNDNTAKIWDARSGAQVLTLEGHTHRVNSAWFSSDGARIVTASLDNTAKVWDARSGAQVLTLEGHSNSVSSASFSPDGARIVTASLDGTAKVWDARSGAQGLTLKGHSGRFDSDGWFDSAWFSPDGARIVTVSSDGTAKVWDARSGAEVLMLEGKVSSASFSPDGARIVTASEDRTASVWDARSGAEVLTFRGHTDWVRSASFSPDGARVVTASGDKTAKVWDARSGAQLLTLRGHTDYVGFASFSPDGARVVTASRDGKTLVWDSTPLNREFLRGEPGSPSGALK